MFLRLCSFFHANKIQAPFRYRHTDKPDDTCDVIYHIQILGTMFGNDLLAISVVLYFFEICFILLLSTFLTYLNDYDYIILLTIASF